MRCIDELGYLQRHRDWATSYPTPECAAAIVDWVTSIKKHRQNPPAPTRQTAQSLPATLVGTIQSKGPASQAVALVVVFLLLAMLTMSAGARAQLTLNGSMLAGTSGMTLQRKVQLVVSRHAYGAG